MSFTDTEKARSRPRLPRVFRSVTNPEVLKSFYERAHSQYGHKIEPVTVGRLCLELLMLKELQITPALSDEAVINLRALLENKTSLFNPTHDTSPTVLETSRALSAKNKAVLSAGFVPSPQLMNERHTICEAVKQTTGLYLDDPLSGGAVGSDNTPEYGWMVSIARTVPNGRHILHRSEIHANLRDSVSASLSLGAVIID